MASDEQLREHWQCLHAVRATFVGAHCHLRCAWRRRNVRGTDVSSPFVMMNRNKRGVALNLRSDEGCAALGDLIGALPPCRESQLRFPDGALCKTLRVVALASWCGRLCGEFSHRCNEKLWCGLRDDGRTQPKIDILLTQW